MPGRGNRDVKSLHGGQGVGDQNSEQLYTLSYVYGTLEARLQIQGGPRYRDMREINRPMPQKALGLNPITIEGQCCLVIRIMLTGAWLPGFESKLCLLAV